MGIMAMGSGKVRAGVAIKVVVLVGAVVPRVMVRAQVNIFYHFLVNKKV